nr:MAG TPA_asm: hypothetical protein [Caudoviricetes sp.]
MINTYINTINLNILNSPIFGNTKVYCKAVKTAPHTSRSVRGVVFWLAIYFLLPNFLSIYIFTLLRGKVRKIFPFCCYIM